MSATTKPAALDQAAKPADIVRNFLLFLQAGELDEALELLDENVEYVNVSLPTIHGRRRVERVFRPMLEKLGGGFRVHFHAVATDGNTVLTDRTDELSFGPVAQRLWVYGRFEIVDGKITVWRDSFDWFDVLVGLVRGLLGAVIPSLNRPWPGDS
jgi:limonene-1,2-epoxide hydrolase